MSSSQIIIAREQIAFFCLHIEADHGWNEPEFRAARLWALLRDSALYKTFTLSDLYPDEEKLKRILSQGGGHIRRIEQDAYNRGYRSGVQEERSRQQKADDENRRTAEEALKISEGIRFAAERAKLDEGLTDYYAKFEKLQEDIRQFNKALSRFELRYDTSAGRLRRAQPKGFTTVGDAILTIKENQA